MRPTLLFALGLCLAACATPPDVPPPPGGPLAAPELGPLDAILAAADSATASPEVDLLARAAAVNARAVGLRPAQ